MELDLTALRAHLPASPRVLFATVSGAHLYGFESRDSDVDLRGANVLPLTSILGLGEPDETVVVSEVRNGVEIDLVTHDIRKFARLMTRRNGYVLEQLYSPLVVAGERWLDELREIGRGCIVRQVYHHYRGFAHNQIKAVEASEGTVKDLLYAYRVLLTGIHLLHTGAVQSNLRELLEKRSVDSVGELIARKVGGREKEPLVSADRDAHLPLLWRLESELAEAFVSSNLPDEPTTIPALSDFVVRARLALGRDDG